MYTLSPGSRASLVSRDSSITLCTYRQEELRTHPEVLRIVMQYPQIRGARPASLPRHAVPQPRSLRQPQPSQPQPQPQQRAPDRMVLLRRLRSKLIRTKPTGPRQAIEI
ncbi:hypothetical protein EC988_009170 [Linderina pennispora]|nr:hypothetical protein EC988_009170 [Linderina pennispora]